VARRSWGEDSIYWWEARKRFVGLTSRGFDSDGKRIRPRVYGRTKTEVRDKLKELKEKLDAELETVRKNRDRLRPVLDAIGWKQLRKLSADDVHRAGGRSLSVNGDHKGSRSALVRVSTLSGEPRRHPDGLRDETI
jgi:hypothetical protein